MRYIIKSGGDYLKENDDKKDNKKSRLGNGLAVETGIFGYRLFLRWCEKFIDFS